MRIERNAVTADTGAWRELHEAERLGCRCVDHFPDVNSELFTDDHHLVDETDVDRPEGILEQLDELGRLSARNRDNDLETRRIKRRRDFSASGRDTADDFRRVLGVPVWIARIDSLGAESEEHVL